jgi:hypothetical protein
MKGLEPSTFCMANRSRRVEVTQESADLSHSSTRYIRLDLPIRGQRSPTGASRRSYVRNVLACAPGEAVGEPMLYPPAAQARHSVMSIASTGSPGAAFRYCSYLAARSASA